MTAGGDREGPDQPGQEMTLAGGSEQADLPDMLRRVRFCDYFEILGVSRKAADWEIEERARLLLERHDPSRYAGRAPDDVLHGIHEIRSAILDAWDVLLDRVMRERYRKALVS